VDSTDLIVVGSGPAGYSAALEGSKIGLTVAIIEKFLLGGTCLNIGCIPSKFFLHLSYIYCLSKKYTNSIFTHSSLLNKNYLYKKELLLKLRGGLSFLFKKYGVSFIEGKLLEFDNFKVTAILKTNGIRKNILFNFLILSVGSKPSNKCFSSKYDGFSILSSNEALNFKYIPKNVVILGAGAIGTEIASIYKCLGSSITIIEFNERPIPSFDSDVSDYFLKTNSPDFKFLLNFKITGLFKVKGVLFLTLKKGSRLFSLKTSRVIVCVGRVPNSLNKNCLSLVKDNRGFFIVNKNLRTRFSNILVAGDAVYGPMLAHKAEREGISASKLLVNRKAAGLNYNLIPNVIYTYPEVASVGLVSKEATSLNISFFSKNSSFLSNGRFLSSREVGGFIKMNVCRSSGRLLGSQVIHKNSSDLIVITSAFMFYKGTVFDIVNAVFPHPTLSECIYDVASNLIRGFFTNNLII